MSPHQVGFLGWFSGDPWIAWAMAALVMGMSEMLTGDLVLLMLAGYAWFSRQDLPLELLIRGFGLGIALLMALVALHHRHHHRQAPRHKEIA